VTRPFVLLAGGGTGGHVFPLVALAEAFERLAPEVDFAFVGSENGLEARVIPARGWTLETLPAEPMKGRSLLGALRGGAVAGAATLRATALVMKRRPKLVVSIGGYAAGPVSLAAAAVGVPVALLEPNRTAGLTQKMLTPIARRVYVGFPEALAALGDKGRALGVPLRRGFVPAKATTRVEGAPLRIFVMGGSQGAEHLNQTMPAAIARLARKAKVTVLHQAGRGRDADVRRRYAQAFDMESARAQKDDDEDTVERARRKGPVAPPVEVVEFIDDVQAKITDADLVVARSGALTCAELCAIGRPAILVPYPHAADDHQAANAESLAGAGAAIAIRQEKADADALCAAIASLVTDDAKRARMADAARLRGAPDAADVITRDLLALAGLGGRGSF
jgi:UDP-N-acetylglucosamine--N-acetylmuramyl-(pentapeptide) pyrophosphoryl-undecaprenol N-acetylglucosamine transferase